MDSTTPVRKPLGTTDVWRPLFPHDLRPEARRAAAEYDIGPGEFANLCMRYVLDRLGKLPRAFALDEDEQFITAGWDLAYSSLEQRAHNGPASVTTVASLSTAGVCTDCGRAIPVFGVHVCADSKGVGHG